MTGKILALHPTIAVTGSCRPLPRRLLDSPHEVAGKAAQACSRRSSPVRKPVKYYQRYKWRRARRAAAALEGPGQ